MGRPVHAAGPLSDRVGRRPMLVLPITCALIGIAIPFTPLAHVLGFTALPVAFFLILLAMVIMYLALVELVKARFYAIQGRPRRTRPTHEQRRHRHVRRRASRFTYRPRHT